MSNDLLSKLYGQLETFSVTVGLDLTIFPRSSEAAQARGKVKDILTLDEIAKEAGEYRPVTCFPVASASYKRFHHSISVAAAVDTNMHAYGHVAIVMGWHAWFPVGGGRPPLRRGP